MKRLKNELNALVNRGVDRHLRLAVTGLSRSGKTAFITAMVNQLLNIHAGARLPLLSAVREERLLGVKRIPQRDFGIPRFTYDEGLAQLYGDPPAWPTPTRGVSEIRLALRYKSNDSLLRHFKDTSTLYLEIVDYPGEWLLDLPPRGPIISTTANSRGCTLFSQDALFCLAIWQERPRCNSSHGQMSMPGASPNWRRPISTPMPECCASGLIITARKW